MKLRLEMTQEKLRQQHVKELEEKELDMENVKSSALKKVGWLAIMTFHAFLYDFF